VVKISIHTSKGIYYNSGQVAQMNVQVG